MQPISKAFITATITFTIGVFLGALIFYFLFDGTMPWNDAYDLAVKLNFVTFIPCFLMYWRSEHIIASKKKRS